MARRWYQFRLRTLFIVTAMLALWLGRTFNAQRVASRAIVQLGGHVTYDYQARTGVFQRDADMPGPAWLRLLIGKDHFISVQGVDLSFTGVTDADVARHLQKLPDVRSLQLDGTRLGDGVLRSVERMSRLRNLMLFGTRVTDDGLVYLEGLSYLRNLDLRNTQVTEEGVKRLQKRLPNCRINAGQYNMRTGELIELSETDATTAEQRQQ